MALKAWADLRTPVLFGAPADKKYGAWKPSGANIRYKFVIKCFVLAHFQCRWQAA